MVIMQCRYTALQEALAGYDKTGVPLVAYNGKALLPAGFSDDIGTYYFIPKIAHTFSLSITQSINIFFVGMLLISLILSVTGFFLLFRSWTSRFISVVGLLGLAFLAFRIGDVYLIFVYTILSLIPIFLYLIQNEKLKTIFTAFIFLSGIGIGTAHYSRSHAGTAVLIFLIIMLMLYLKRGWREKLGLVALLLVGFSVSAIYFNALLSHRETYLVLNQPNYKPVVGSHPFWHSVYLGFGFLNNDYGIKYSDSFAFNKVRSISPKTIYLSQEYETILKGEVIKIVKYDRHFVVYTAFAKIGVAFFYLLVCANIGLLASIFYPKGWSMELAFWLAIGFNALFGILVVPSSAYFLGFIALATVYGITSIGYAIQQGALSDIKNFMHRKEIQIRQTT